MFWFIHNILQHVEAIKCQTWTVMLQQSPRLICIFSPGVSYYHKDSLCTKAARHYVSNVEECLSPLRPPCVFCGVLLLICCCLFHAGIPTDSYKRLLLSAWNSPWKWWCEAWEGCPEVLKNLHWFGIYSAQHRAALWFLWISFSSDFNDETNTAGCKSTFWFQRKFKSL